MTTKILLYYIFTLRLLNLLYNFVVIKRASKYQKHKNSKDKCTNNKDVYIFKNSLLMILLIIII